MKKDRKWKLILAAILALFTIVIFSIYPFTDNIKFRKFVSSSELSNKEILLSLSSMIIMILSVIAVEIERHKFDLKSQNISNETQNLQNNLTEDFFNNLIRINFKYIDQYYLQTQQQANKSFRLCFMLSVIGVISIITGITMVIISNTSASYIILSFGSLIEIISAVFFYFYNRTIISMDSYHKKLVLTQNIALALKMSQEIPEQNRVEVQTLIIKSLIENVNSLLIYEDKINSKLEKK